MKQFKHLKRGKLLPHRKHSACPLQRPPVCGRVGEKGNVSFKNAKSQTASVGEVLRCLMVQLVVHVCAAEL